MTYFIPMRHKEAMDILAKVYQQAMAEADVIGKRQKLTMRVEPLRPVHLNLTETTFKLEYNSGNEKAYTLQQNCAIFLAGIEQYEAGLTHIKLRNGKKYLGDWVTRPVYKYQEQMGVYAGALDRYAFRSSEAMGVQLKGVTADPDAWFIGYAVVPEALADSKIIV